MLEQSGQAAQPEDQSGARGWRADGGGGASTPGNDGDAGSGGDLDDRANFVDRTGKEHGFRRAALDDVRAEVHAAEDVGGADDSAQLVENGDVHGRFPRPR